MRTPDQDAPLRVLHSTPRPGPRTNPYVVQLQESLREAGVEVLPFTWRVALLGRYDALHTHWPELLVRGRGRRRAAARQALTVLLAARLALGRVPVVRTLHNLRPHEALRSRSARLAMALLEGRETWWVRLNDHTPVRDPARTSTAPLGDYLRWAAGRPTPDTVPGRVVAPGLVRAYKGLDELVVAFASVPGPGLSLHVVGRCEDPALAERLRSAATADPRIVLRLTHVDDDEFATAVGEAQLVVLPYRAMHNSSTALMALSLRRPVLVPRAAVTERLAADVGRSWVLTEDMSDPARLAQALTAGLARTGSAPAQPPDLSQHGWARIAQVHLQAYRSAVEAGSTGATR